MNSLYLLIPIVLLGIFLAMGLLFWAIRSGQYDDLDKESQRILFDDPERNTSADNLDKNNSENKPNS